MCARRRPPAGPSWLRGRLKVFSVPVASEGSRSICPAGPGAAHPTLTPFLPAEGSPGQPLRWKQPGCPPPSFPSCRHLKEISELQSQQKQEIEALYRRLGKPLPPNLGLFHTAPPAGRRRKSKSKLKAGKLLSPLVQQLKVVASSTGVSPPGCWSGWGRGRAGGRLAPTPGRALLRSPFTRAGKPLQV